MELKNYKGGDVVEVLIYNPKNENLNEWREGEVLDVRIIYPDNGARHKPYSIVIVRVRRTYLKASPVYHWHGNIPVFVGNDFEFYDKENDEGFIHENQIRLKT